MFHSELSLYVSPFNLKTRIHLKSYCEAGQITAQNWDEPPVSSQSHLRCLEDPAMGGSEGESGTLNNPPYQLSYTGLATF